MIIEDGKGSGNKAQVSDHRLQVSTASALHRASLKGNAYAWNSVSYDAAAADTLLLVANNSSVQLLVIDSIYFYADAATAVDIHFPAKATWTGTAVTGVNLNRVSNKIADATAITDETGQATQGPIWITLHTIELTTAQGEIQYLVNGAIILGKDDAIAMDAVADLAGYEATIVGYFIDIPK